VRVTRNSGDPHFADPDVEKVIVRGNKKEGETNGFHAEIKEI
jgi:hypothetical protein